MKLLQPNCLYISLGLTLLLTPGCRAQGTQLNPNPAGQSRLTPASQQTENNVPTNPALTDPTLATKQAPATFKAKFVTTQGDFVIEVNRAWSPNAADRFYNLVDIGFFQNTVVFRAISGFMFQFGIHADPAVNAKWGEFTMPDDPMVGISNMSGYITFAKTGAPNSRSTQMFINLGNNVPLDGMKFTPFGKVVEGLDVLEKINTEYDENDPAKNVQGNFKAKGNDYILKEFPNLDIIRSVTLIEAEQAEQPQTGQTPTQPQTEQPQTQPQVGSNTPGGGQ